MKPIHLLTFAPLLLLFRRSSTPLKAVDQPHLNTLDPAARPSFQHLLVRAYVQSPSARIASSRRTVAEQNRLYAQGRTTKGAIITGARGCQSWHVLGRAVDLTGLSDKQLRDLGAWWKSQDGHWGGDFTNLYDPGHFEYHPGQTIEQACPDPDAFRDA